MAQQAVAVEPEAPVGHQLEAWALVHDRVGRQFHPGYDREGARAAFRKALELDPDDERLRTDYAILLEHDAGGVRYADDADLDQAIAEYRRALETRDSPQIADNLLIALMWSQRFDELRQELERRGDSDQRAYLSLIATAVLDGPEAALRAARRRFADLGQRVTQVSTAARQLMLLRRYEPAAALFRGVGRDAPNAAALLSMADLLNGTRPHETVSPDLTTPGGLLQAFLIALARPGDLDVDRVVGLMAPSLRRQMQPKDREEAVDLIQGLLHSSLDSTGVPRDVLLDLVLGSLETAVKKETEFGSRVTMRISVGGQTTANDLFLTREGDEYRVVAFEQAPGLAGYEVLDLLQRGELEGARAWLDLIGDAETATVDPREPYSGSLFRRFWPAGQEDPGEPAMRLAARVLLATSGDEDAVRDALAPLREAREQAPESRRKDFDLVSAVALAQIEEWKELRPVAERLIQAEPESDLAFSVLMTCLQNLGDSDALERVARQRLEGDPDDVEARLGLQEAALWRGEVDKALSILTGILSGPAPPPVVFNNAAWYSLVEGRADEQSLGWAKEAAQRSRYRDRAILHTLASIYAELARPEEAYRILLQGMEVEDGKPESADWYVLGRLAELYGLPDAARRYYQRVEGGEERLPATSVWSLAQRRLRGLPRETQAADAGEKAAGAGGDRSKTSR